MARGAAGLVLTLATLVAACSVPLETPPTAPDVQLVDRADELGVSEFTRTWSVDVLDYDGDGTDDFFFTYHTPKDQQVRMYLGGEDGFTNDAEVTDTFPLRDRHDCDWADIDGDGRTDAYCTIGAQAGRGEGANEVWIAGEDGKLVDEVEERGGADRFGRGRHASLRDMDGDGDVDVVLTNDPRRDGRPSENQILRNEDGLFEPVPSSGLEAAGGGSCLDVADVDGDGNLDVVICSNRPAQLFTGNGDLTFDDRTDEMQLPGRQAQDAIFADVDGDERTDLVAAVIDEIVVQRGTPGGLGPPETVFSFSHDPRGRDRRGNVRLATGDADGDGDLDIFLLLGQRRCDGSSTLNDEPDLLLLGDGRGGVEALVTGPENPGCGNAAAAIDATGDGDAEFVVLNGSRLAEGPVQILDLVETS